MVNPIRSVRSAARLPVRPRIHVRGTEVPILRDRERRPFEVGPDPLEARAIAPDLFAGATLPERIVYKKLSQLMQGTNGFIFQRAANGGRTRIGGFVLDFLLVDRDPFAAIEVLGSHWHQAEQEFSDAERALAVLRLGYQYTELWDYDIYHSDTRLEELLMPVIERRSGFRGAFN